MNLISTRIHGYLDYSVAFLLIIAPWLFGFARGGAETWVPVGQGIVVIIYSLLTNYELGLSKILSMRLHLLIDLVGAVVLAFSPWMFHFSDYVWAPHIIFGVLEMVVVSLSVSVSGTEVKQKQFSPLKAEQ